MLINTFCLFEVNPTGTSILSYFHSSFRFYMCKGRKLHVRLACLVFMCRLILKVIKCLIIISISKDINYVKDNKENY